MTFRFVLKAGESVIAVRNIEEAKLDTSMQDPDVATEAFRSMLFRVYPPEQETSRRRFESLFHAGKTQCEIVKHLFAVHLAYDPTSEMARVCQPMLSKHRYNRLAQVGNQSRKRRRLAHGVKKTSSPFRLSDGQLRGCQMRRRTRDGCWELDMRDRQTVGIVNQRPWVYVPGARIETGELAEQKPRQKENMGSALECRICRCKPGNAMVGGARRTILQFQFDGLGPEHAKEKDRGACRRQGRMTHELERGYAQVLCMNCHQEKTVSERRGGGAPKSNINSERIRVVHLGS